MRGLRQVVNKGKGAAVKAGYLYSRANQILMLDADGATDFNEIEGIYNKAEAIIASDNNRYACVIGSRNLAEKEVKRTALRKGLNTIMIKLCGVVLGS